MSTFFPTPDALVRSFSAPPVSGARPIPQSTNHHRSQSNSVTGARAIPIQQSKSIDRPMPKSACECYTEIQDLLLFSGEVDAAKYDAALKMYNYAKSKSLFTPMSCSIATGTGSGDFKELCKQMILGVRDQLQKMAK